MHYHTKRRKLCSSLYSFSFLSFPFVLNALIYYDAPADSKTLKEEKREELFEELKNNESIGWAVDVIDPRELSAKMLKRLVVCIITNFQVF